MNPPVAATQIKPPYPIQVSMNLTTTYCGCPTLVHPSCRFSYTLNFEKRSGSACLHSIDSFPINIPMYPLGGEGLWDFVSVIQPTRFTTSDQSVTIYRVALNIDLFTREASAALLLGSNGNTAVGTDNFDPFCMALDRHGASISYTIPFSILDCT